MILRPRKGPPATDAASVRGEAAIVCKGRLVDIASGRQAEGIVRQAEMIAR
jgi:malyl-CoA/(S)-citramalyl-CoA lyase